jgi:PTH2 family peptidyl-tRNA hydrolase
MYFVVNADLKKMKNGKTAAQVAHVAGMITEEIMRNYFEHGRPSEDAIIDYDNYQEWKINNQFAKVVLRAPEAELLNLIGTEKKCRFVRDAGRTQIAENSLTVVGFFPRNDIGDKLKNYKLL